jgi:hypothetical protein
MMRVVRRMVLPAGLHDAFPRMAGEARFLLSPILGFAASPHQAERVLLTFNPD